MIAEAIATPIHSDVITTGGAILVALVTAIGGVQTALIHAGNKAAKNAAHAAAIAAEQTETNGDDHSAVLEVIEQMQAELIRQRLDADERARQAEARHRETRADIGGIREEQRLDREARQQLAQYVIKNLPNRQDD